jgi:hypothetical protein
VRGSTGGVGLGAPGGFRDPAVAELPSSARDKANLKTCV